jgi:arginine N-succinyltransferase
VAQYVLVRPVRLTDLHALQTLADHLDTVNLPDDPVALAGIIADSERSFANLLNSNTTSKHDHKHAGFTFVAVEIESVHGVIKAERLIGTASLFAFHGTAEDPHYYLNVNETTVHSKQLNTDRKRLVLKLGRDTDPWTELGGLVVHPDARGKGVGKLLVATRLLFIAMHRQQFCQRVIAELLPPRRADGGNAFWDAVGGPLTGLPYYRADLLCRSDKEFIDAFFPHEEIVCDLLPPEARSLIGIEGPTTTPVRKLLQRAGFRFLGTVDPFDAGPHDGATITDIPPIQHSRRLIRLDLPPIKSTAPYLLGNPTTHEFMIDEIDIEHDGVRLNHYHAARFQLAAGQPCWAMPMQW